MQFIRHRLLAEWKQRDNKMFPQPKKPSPDYRILKLRKFEEANRAMTDHLKVCATRDEMAAWENKTDAKIEQNKINQRFAELKAKAEAQVDKRREKLAEKLYAEEIMLQAELKSNQITPEQRRAELEDRARALMNEREQERKQFADQMLYRQWREGCDGVRAGDSKAILMKTVAARADQVVDKELVKRHELFEKKQFDEMYERDRLKKEKRYAIEVKERKERDEEALRVLDEQVADIRVRRAEAEEVVKHEIIEMKKRWAEENAAHEAEVAARYERNKIIGEELKRFNVQKQAEMQAIKDREEAYDKQMVLEAQRQAEEEEDREAELKDRKKEEDRMFRQHLAMLMVKEQESNEERDRLIKEQQDAHEAKRQAQKDAEEAARAKLMSEVYEDRDRQIAEKDAKRQALAAEKMIERERMEREMAEMAAVEQEYSTMLHAQRVQNRLDIEAQIRAKEDAALKEKEEAVQAWEGALLAEEQYQRMINYDATQPKPAPNFNRKSTKWFS